MEKQYYSGLKVPHTKYNILDYVPYQKCPLCEGTGTIKHEAFDDKCPVCNGERIIPMHIIKEELKVVENNKISITCHNRCGNTLPSNNEHNNICLNCGSSIILLL
jgi:Zn finger protein HypA/HybF involved in hydrogenase expression